MTTDPISVRLCFNNKSPDNLQLIRGVACLATPLASKDKGSRQGVTGYWVQLEDKDKQVIYRQDRQGMMIPVSKDRTIEELSSFDVLVPFMTDAKYVAVFAPPRDHQGVLPKLGMASQIIGRFPFPALNELVRTGDPVQLPSDICGAGRGQVLSYSSLIYHGSSSRIPTLVILGDKFGSSDQTTFETRARDCIRYLYSKEPFTNLLGSDSMNVFLVQVESNAQNPSYFNSVYSDQTGTLVSWETDCVKKVCDTLFSNDGKPYWSWASLLINENDKRIGTQRGNQFASGTYEGKAFQTLDDAVITFQHEFGHAAFNLGDEYGGTKGVYTGTEPNQPNLTVETDATKIKWKDFLTEGISIPTLNNPANCGQKDPSPNPVDDSSVGSYSGGMEYSCGIFHPQYNCVMNDQSKADGVFCKVCLHEAIMSVARSSPLLVPAPGSIFYSPLTQKWSNVLITPNILESFDTLSQFSLYDEVIKELTSGTVGQATLAAFKAAKHPLPNNPFKVIQSFNDQVNDEFVWYLIDQNTKSAYYVHAFSLHLDSELHTGQIALPDFPQLVLFDGAYVGTQINLFCADNGMLSYGIIGPDGEIIGAKLAVQTVSGLQNDLSAIGVDYLAADSQIWVAVIDQLKVKIAAYQLNAASWWPRGFVEMPTSTETDFENIKIVKVQHFVFVVASAANGIFYNTFDSINGNWSGNPSATPITSKVNFFDISSDGQNLYLVTSQEDGTAQICLYSLLTNSWNNEIKDISKQLQLNPETVLSSLGVTVLHNMLYIIVLVNQLPNFVIYNLSNMEWTVLQEIQQLATQNNNIASLMVHSTSSQVYVGLSAPVAQT
jgi:hypothetical protein